MQKTYFKKFEIRWSDIDANRHLANSSYVQFCSHTRLSFMEKHGWGQKMFEQKRLGPAAIRESYHFFREVHTTDTLYISLELTGLSNEGSFFEFRHRIYRQDGKNVAYSSIAGCWISLDTRQVTIPPQDLFALFKEVCPTADDFRTITRKDLRISHISPKHIDPKYFQERIDS